MQPKYFDKMHGLGNDFIVINALTHPFDWDKTQIAQLANRHTGIGFDQLLIIEPSPLAECDFAYRIFNANGQEVEHCGNGARCFGKYIRDQRLFDFHRPLKVLVKKGIIAIEYIDSHHQVDYFRIDMGEPNFSPLSRLQHSALNQPLTLTLADGIQTLHCALLSMGNPHAVFNVDSFNDHTIAEIGHRLQQHPLFPEQVNVGFMRIERRDSITLRVFERGVGETQACGTGACAAVAAGIRQGKLDNRVNVQLLGGSLTIDWQGAHHPLYMTGPAEQVYRGQLP